MVVEAAAAAEEEEEEERLVPEKFPSTIFLRAELILIWFFMLWMYGELRGTSTGAWGPGSASDG